MPSAKLSALTDLAGAQVPGDLVYIVDVSAGASGSKRSTLNDFLGTITKNITDISVQFQDGDGTSTVSAASNGKLRYSQGAASTAGSFQASENGAAYQNLIKGPASAGNLTANLLPFATAGDVIGDTSWAQLGSTTSRTTSFNPQVPGASLSSYGSFRAGIVDEGAMTTIGLFGLFPSIKGNFYIGTLASPIATTANAAILTITASGQISTTPGVLNNGCTITIKSTAAWSASEGGTSFEIKTNKEGVAPNNAVARLLINQNGCFHVAPTVASGESTSGTLELFRVGGSGYVTDDLALSFFADTSTSGSAAVKNIVSQQKGSQTGALFEAQSASGVPQFGIYPQIGTVCHFAEWVGSTNTPTVAASGLARLFVDTNGVLELSQGGGGWGNVMGRQIAVKTANYTVKVGDTGCFFTNEGALGSVTFTLPALPSTIGFGVVYTFYVRTNQSVVIQLPASTVLRNGSGSTSAAGTATNTAQFDLIKIVGKRDGSGANPEYIVETVGGTWTLA